MANKKKIIAGVLVSGLFLSIYLFSATRPVKEPPGEKDMPAPPAKETVLPEPVAQIPAVEPETPSAPDPMPTPKPEPMKKEKKTVEIILERGRVEDSLPDQGDAEMEYEQNRHFEELVKGSFPVHTIQTHNPLDTRIPGPPQGEIWVRIKPENAGEMNQIMSELADLYRDIRIGYEENVVVMHWVGAQPYARRTFYPDGSIR